MSSDLSDSETDHSEFSDHGKVKRIDFAVLEKSTQTGVDADNLVEQLQMKLADSQNPSVQNGEKSN